MTTWSFTWVNSWRHKNHWLFFSEAEGACLRITFGCWEKALALWWNCFDLLSYSIFWRNSEQLHGPALEWVIEDLSVEVYVLLTLESLLNLICQLEWLLIRKREGEGKVSGLVLGVWKHVAKLQSELFVIIEVSLRLRHYPTPFLLLGRHHCIYWLQTLVV